MTISRLDPPRVFGYRRHIYGLPEADPRRTSVEFTLTVVESGFAQVSDADQHRTAFDGNTEGWRTELGELVAYLDGRA